VVVSKNYVRELGHLAQMAETGSRSTRTRRSAAERARARTGRVGRGRERGAPPTRFDPNLRGISPAKASPSKGCKRGEFDPVGRDPLDEKVRAWWLEVLSGEQGRDHPIYGPNLRAKLSGDVLEVSGLVESKDADEKLRAEILTLTEGGICRVRFKCRWSRPGGSRVSSRRSWLLYQ